MYPRIQKIVTPPSSFPVSLTDVKQQAIIDHAGDDELLKGYIGAATDLVEQVLQRKLVTQTWKMFLPCFPASNQIELLFGDLQSITHIKYTDSDEVTDTFSSDNYLVDTDSIPGRVILADGESWPTDSLSPKNAVEIQFVTGYPVGTTVGNASLDLAYFGLDDLVSGGTFSGTEPAIYQVEIDASATPDTFKWSKNYGADEAATVAITGGAQALDNGVTITFGATTGHTVGDKWEFIAGSTLNKGVRSAVLYLVSHFNDNREILLVGTIFTELPMTAQALLSNHRVWNHIL